MLLYTHLLLAVQHASSLLLVVQAPEHDLVLAYSPSSPQHTVAFVSPPMFQLYGVQPVAVEVQAVCEVSLSVLPYRVLHDPAPLHVWPV